MKRIGVGLIGSGFMGKCHALAWNSVHQVFGGGLVPELVCLAEVTRELAQVRAKQFGFGKSSADWQDVVADPDIDVISITSPNQFHPEMAIAALKAGKHIWCEKPMAPTFDEATAMHSVWEKSGKVAVLGYNYIQNPAIRHMRKLLAEGAIGTVNHIRLEMDEDFMADSQAPFFWKNSHESGYGALDDFAVHPLSIIHNLIGPVERVICDMSKPYPTRKDADGTNREVETYDIANVLFRTQSKISGSLAVNRCAWGRKGGLNIQIFGHKGSILYDQERMNELKLYIAEGVEDKQGYTTILTAPCHPPYDQFIPAPGHGLGFNDLKVIECRELLNEIMNLKSNCISFDAGIVIEKSVHAMARSFSSSRWEYI
jgi:predicted dehydrogenase